MRLHILFDTLLAKRVTCAQLHYFHKLQNAVLIFSQDTQERIAQNRSCDKSFSFDFSFSRSILCSLGLSHSVSSVSVSRFFLCLSLFSSVTPSVQLLLSFPFYLFLVSFLFSHIVSPSRSDSLHLSFPFSFSAFFSFSLLLSVWGQLINYAWVTD